MTQKDSAVSSLRAGVTFYLNPQILESSSSYVGLHVVETTGAGDAFCSGFLTGVGEGKEPRDCAALATACSSLVIQAAGATAGMKRREDVEKFIRSQPKLSFQDDV